jgi:ribosomal protein S18 acetylase RimI-like enzyme
MANELNALFRRNFPFVVREEATVQEILENKECKIIEKRNARNEVVGAAVLHDNTILMLCVDKEYRNRGIGSELLSAAEEAIKADGFNEVTVGAGYDYLMPGVPTSKRYVDAVNEKLYDGIDETASAFFEKRGYTHSWDCNCFDMRFPLTEFSKEEYKVGDTVDGICYRFATETDAPKVWECTDAAYEEFTQYYKNMELYRGEGKQNPKVLIATDNDEVVETLFVNLETEGEGLGSVGCTTVKPSHRGRHIGVNMVTIGTKYLKDAGMREAYLGYTYTGLDHMYGYAGYKICIYYMMAKKVLR